MKILVVRQSRIGRPGGINTTITNTARELEKLGHQLFPFEIEDNDDSYSAIKKQFAEFYEEVAPDAVHIYNELIKGRAARSYCLSHKIPFTTAFVTNHEEKPQNKKIPKFLIWAYLRWFHRGSAKIHVTTATLKDLLRSKGFKQEIVQYSRGIDFDKFYYNKNASGLSGFPRPFFMTMSHISPKKNIEAFLELDLPRTKFVIGEGPSKKNLMKKWGQEALFLPYENVAEVLSQGDVFVCPSRFETFGLVMIEAMASGLPVAAFPVMGPKDIIEEGVTGFMDSDLKKAALACLKLKKEDCIRAVKHYTWESHTKNFLENLALIR